MLLPRTVRRRTTAAVLATTLIAAVAGCAPIGERRLDFRHTETVEITEIAIVSPGSGDVVVRTRPGDTVEIRRTVRYQRTEPGATYRIDGTVLELDTGCGWRCGVSYDIDAPPGVSVRGENGSGQVMLFDVTSVSVSVGSGAVTVDGATGDVTAQSGSGGITVSRAAGPVTVTTGSGSIEGRDLGGGGVMATAGSGSVTLSLTDPGPVRAEAASGSVHVTVPPGSYQVRTETGSGTADVEIPDTADGEHLIDARTGSGSITIDQR
ncbi:DUF4097 family beta strand repeat-containing protein [Solwaraspora sp. WMMD791]|uniref:DUF4097 family beta strand repeat-containing protein n=1 Tax=Solwaraspora sp. WMMD791 TaxID=3016086 RepID=UPI00249A93D5|nr:DUF4097 family beta strand repeat-containing protein [Solwaraspora sp. WMMD791]WFE29788.1 DUF4097 family beta strand repeat-containing protein [Solwaraspora sp. WMMD791]